MTTKMRVHELAKQFDVTSKVMLAALQEVGTVAKSHMSIVTDEDIALVTKHFKQGESEAKKAFEKSRRVEVEKAKPKARRLTAREKLAAKRKAEAESEAAPEAEKVEEPAKPEPLKAEKIVDTSWATAAAQAASRTKPPEPEVKEPEATAAAPEPAKPAKPKPPQRDMQAVARAAAETRARLQSESAQSSRPAPRVAEPPKRPADKGKAAADADRGKPVDAQSIRRSVRQTLSRFEMPRQQRPAARPSRKPSRRVREDKKERAARHRAREEAQRTASNVIKITEYITVQELAEKLQLRSAELIGKLMGMGVMATINQRLERDSIELLLADYEVEVEWLEEYGEDILEASEPEGESVSRDPVVTVMGHVDHGKTSLLDHIRSANVIAGEAGGITQHIGAYRVKTSRGHIAFLDTPGHEAFTAMRARGAQVTDIVIVVIAADDKIMPQTVEAIDHARASKCPIIIAINKIDLPAADPDGVKRQLMEHNVVLEEFGGDVQAVPISAKHGTNVDQLLEAVALQAEIMELKAVAEGKARGIVIESRKDPGRGVSFTVLVQQGTLKVGDPFVAGWVDGRVRTLRDEYDKEITEASPAHPAVVYGANDVPIAGDQFAVVASEREAKEIASNRRARQREQAMHAPKSTVKLENLFDRMQEGEQVDLNLVVKGDVAGSVEALCDSLMNLSNEKVLVRVIHRGVGAISENDVMLAAASGAVIVGFHLHPNNSILEEAKRQNISLELYNVIYEAVEDVKKAMTGLLAPVEKEVITGSAEVRELFKVPKMGVIAGSYVLDGTIKRNARVRVIRDQVQIYDSKVGSLRRFKEDVREVASGFECGIGVDGYQDLKVGDVLQVYEVQEVAQEL